ncbi:MAG: RND family transporter [Methanomicrobiaceae archaeon]|nr:RND family transporter [Methanomicrobiaceae archaeon]
MSSLYGAISRLVNKNPRLVLGIMTLLLIAGLFTLPGLSFQSTSDQYLDKSTPDGIRYDQYNDQFVSDTFILLIQTSDTTDYELMQSLLVLEEEINRLDYVYETVSIADVLKELNGGVLPESKADTDYILSQIPESDKTLLIPDSQTALAYVKIGQGISTDTSVLILPKLEVLAYEADLPPGVSIEITGNTPYNDELQKDMVISGVVLIGGAFILMTIVLFLLFSNMQYWYLPLILLTFGLMYTFAVMSILGVEINNGAIASFPILLGLGIDYAVQFHARFDEERRLGNSVPKSSDNTLKNTGPAVLLAMLATTMGFIAMFISPVPMIETFAVVSIIGVACCYLTSLFGFPALAAILNYNPKDNVQSKSVIIMNRYNSFLEKVVEKVSLLAVPIIVVAVVIAYAGIYTDPSIPIDTDTKSMAPPDLPAQLTLDKVQDVSGSVTPFPLYIRGDSLKSLDAVLWIDSFGTYSDERHDEIVGVSSVATLLRKYNNGEIPSNQASLNEVMKNIPADDFNQYIKGESEAVISYTTTILTINQQNELKKEVVADASWSEIPPHISVYPTGDFDLYTNLMDQIAESKDKMTLLGFILIFLFLAFAYRKKEALTPIVPIICVVGWNAVAMVLIGLHYNPISACLGSMTIGVASEYTILVMERYIEEKKTSKRDIDAIKKSVKKIGSAVTVSGLVTASGFSALMLSVFPIVSSFGLSTVIAVIFSLVGAIVIMPAVLTVMGSAEGIFGRKKQKAV